MRIVGADLSLTATGLVTVKNGRPVWTELVKPPKPKKAQWHERVAQIRRATLSMAAKADLVALEGPAWAQKDAAFRLGELNGVIKYALGIKGYEITTRQPNEVKLFATGKGNASKEEMVEAAEKKFPHLKPCDNNIADALFLALLVEHDLAEDDDV